MTTLRANDLMRSQLRAPDQIRLVKRSQTVKVWPKAAPVKAAPPAKPAQSAKEPTPTHVRNLLPGLAGLPELHDGLTRDELEAIRRQETEVIIADFRERFPAVFCDPPVPFAIGIDKHLRAATKTIIPSRKLERVIRWWIGQRAYQEALEAGIRRRTLDGSPTSQPSAWQRGEARKRLGMSPVPRPRPVLLSRELRGR